MPNWIDLTGQKFGRLTVIKEHHRIPRKGTYWLCKCDCGKELITTSSLLVSGKSKSCGCYKKEKLRERVTKHGMSGNRLYNSWAAMKARCNNQNCQSYRNYGGRGIKVCEEWQGKDGFEKFSEWALSHGYKDNLTIERINNDGNYEPNNCKWATKAEQSNNKRDTRKYEYMGETHSISEWARIKNMSRNTLSNRLVRGGWSIDQALNAPTHKGVRNG